MKSIRKFALAMLAVGFLASGNSALAADEKPTGTVTIDETQLSLIFGGSSGHGVLKFGGKTYKFKTEGVRVGSVGYEKLTLVGEVYRLKKVEDFAGYYSAAQTGAALIKGLSGYWLSAENGVMIRFKGKSEGAALNLGFSGMKFTME